MTLESAPAVFWVGCAGGMLAELLHWWGLREAPDLPAYAASPLYWGLTLAMIAAGGALAVVYFGHQAQAIAALQIGASTPLVIQKLTTTLTGAGSERRARLGAGAVAPGIRSFFTW
ncbi:MAG TPA: hypothetical protein VGI12_04680 [Vicinamibacterales bacterium]|jgi:hypothetical protein